MKKLIGAVIAAAALALPSAAQGHYPSESYAYYRVDATSYGGACGNGITWYCHSSIWRNCGTLWGSHSRYCQGQFREGTWWGTRVCNWTGRVEHYGNTVTHSKQC